MGSTDASDSTARILGEAAAAIAASGIEAALIGGAAVNAYEDPRFTKDLDLTVEADRGKIRQLVENLISFGFEVTRSQDGNEPSGPDFVQLRRASTSDMIDVIVAKTEFQELVLGRASQVVGQLLPVATPEDLIVLKLIANRSKDKIDAAALARDQFIDWPYVEQWAATWEVTDRLRALRESLEEDRA